ncbi:tetratricopeptide repeat protein [Herbaspirillum sp. GCM10030257]|uniref:tetratricopeptide repeat protein n=1 Tax=Herbaspirillum sp. GCM10030257 TaxID=3273393 RepID=UPI00361AED38
MSLITSVIAQRFSKPQFVALCVCLTVLAGCASPLPNSANDKAGLESSIAAAETELAKGRREQAVALLTEAAQANPTSAAPWLKIANVWFEAGNYPSSILATNEVLQRDPSSQEAKSLLVVAGLRVAAGAVSGLRPNGNIGVSVRSDAENLTNSLRDVLGEKVLVPGQPVEAKPVVAPRPKSQSRPRPRAVVNHPGAPSGTASATSGAASSTRSASTDPFKALK